MSYASKKQYKVALLQLVSTTDYEENLEKLLCYIKEHQDKELIVAPEVYLTAYDYEHFDDAIAFYDRAMAKILPLITTQILVFTIIKKEGENIVNQAVVIHDHKVVYSQNKYKLFKIGNEHKYFQAGEQQDIVSFKINGITYALLICFELRFKALWKQIERVDIVLIPAMWGKPRKRHLEVLSQALATMNQSFVCLCNSANDDMAKSSAVISPWGNVLMDDDAEVIEANINLKEVKKTRRLIPMN